MKVKLGFGALPLEVDVPEEAVLLQPPAGLPKVDWSSAAEAALSAPVGALPLMDLLQWIKTACVLVPDITRKDVSSPLLPVVLRYLQQAGVQYSVGVATGKHPPCVGPEGAWIHRASSPNLRWVGTTAAGTDVHFPAQVVEADLRILIGEIRPHYFTGFAGGAKTLFPGVAGEAGIWHNHELKAAPGARLGVVEGNPCRADLEAAAAFAGPSFILNVIRDLDGDPVGLVAGDPVAAHRRGVTLARKVFCTQAPGRADVVLVSDTLPVAANLYQACKLLAPAGAVLQPGGAVILAVECTEGIGPISIINEKIYQLGLRHSLPEPHRVLLVSGRTPDEVAPTFAEYARSVEEALADLSPNRLIVMPRAGELIPEV